MPALASRAVAFGPAKTYHAHPNNLEAKKTRALSLFIIKNYWYDPKGTTRVDYIPEVMKRTGDLDRRLELGNYDGSAEYWPTVEATELFRHLHEAMLSGSLLSWNATKNVLVILLGM